MKNTTKTVGAFDAKTHFSELLDRVEQRGETITITRHGVTVAILSPPAAAEKRMAPEEILKMAREIRAKSKPLGKLTTKDLINEGRRI